LFYLGALQVEYIDGNQNKTADKARKPDDKGSVLKERIGVYQIKTYMDVYPNTAGLLTFHFNKEEQVM
jgi:hypothetical protein